jgi:hypothetical protein
MWPLPGLPDIAGKQLTRKLRMAGEGQEKEECVAEKGEVMRDMLETRRGQWYIKPEKKE